MDSYRSPSFFRVASYLRIRGRKEPLGFFRVQNINPIKEDLLNLQIIPTRDGKDYLIHFEDHDCTKLPYEIKYVDAYTAKNLCQFIVDTSRGSRIYVPEEERPTWKALFNKINYDLDFTFTGPKFRGVNGFRLANV